MNKSELHVYIPLIYFVYSSVICWSVWNQVWMYETYFDRYIFQKPTVPLHPQTNISVSRVLHNSLHFPIKGDLSELKWTNLFGGINADRPFVCQSVWNSWMGNILNSKTYSTVGHWPLIMAITVGWDDMFVHNTYSFALDLSWTLERGNFVENPFNHLTSTLIVFLWHFAKS